MSKKDSRLVVESGKGSMIWVILTGEAFWQHNISRHPKHLLQHLTVIYSSFISPSLGAKFPGRRRANCVCVPMYVYSSAHRGLANLMHRRCDLGN